MQEQRECRTEVFQVLDEHQHYADTGIQVMPINTLFQLYSMKQNQDAQLEVARQLLFMPDLFSYFLTGVANNEYCIASTSELLDATITKLVNGYHTYLRSSRTSCSVKLFCREQSEEL